MALATVFALYKRGVLWVVMQWFIKSPGKQDTKKRDCQIRQARVRVKDLFVFI